MNRVIRESEAKSWEGGLPIRLKPVTAPNRASKPLLDRADLSPSRGLGCIICVSEVTPRAALRLDGSR